MNSRRIRIGTIGGSIKGLTEACLNAAGYANEFEVFSLGMDDCGTPRSGLLWKLSLIWKAFCTCLRIPRADVVLIIFVDVFAVHFMRVAHLLGKKVVLYWLGSDVQGLMQGSISPKGLDKADFQLSYSEGNIAELAGKGIDAKLVFLPTYLPDDPAQMPSEHAVLLSIPDARREFYGYNDLMRLVDDYPQVKFHVIRTEHPEFYNKPNIVFEGMLNRAEMNEVFDRVSISIRWPEHDGTSLILMESALKGKYLISRNPFPVGMITNTYEGLCAAFDEALAQPLVPCAENRAYALAHFTQAQAGETLARYLKMTLSTTQG